MRKLIIILLFVSTVIQAQTVLTIEGTTTVNTVTGTWWGVNITRSTPTTFTYKNNSITSVNFQYYQLVAGDEEPGATNNNLDGSVITGNRLTWNGTSTTSITHGLFYGYNINSAIKYNYLEKCPYGVVVKSGTDAGVKMTWTSGAISYNIFKNTKQGIIVKGIDGVAIYNNTFYSDASNLEGHIYIQPNQSTTIPTPSQGTKIKNNIFYTKYQISNITLLSADCKTGFECDYNIYYCEAGTPKFFTADNGSLTFAQWQALGYDTHSVVVNPGFTNFTDFVPNVRLNNGTNLGSTFKNGLGKDAVWSTVDPDTTGQNGLWQVGARIYSASDTYAGDYFISPNGSDANAGTITSPWATWDKVTSAITAGKKVYIRGGTYRTNKSALVNTHFTWSGLTGTSSDTIKIFAYPGEKPVLNLNNITITAGYTRALLISGCAYTWVKGLRITGVNQQPKPVSQEAMSIWNMLVTGCSNTVIENCEADHSGMYGFWAQNPVNVLFKNCDTHHLTDPYTGTPSGSNPYDGSNGFYAAGGVTHSATFFGCRAWFVCDDGWDMFRSDVNVTIDSCWSFWNGYSPAFAHLGNGDGDGFKLGPNTTNYSTTHLRTITNCLSVGNYNNGFDQNTLDYSNIFWFYNNVSYKNGNWGIHFHYPNVSSIINIVRNNIAYKNTSGNASLWPATIHDHNSWDGGFTDISDAYFLNLDTSQLNNPRQADGSLPVITFAHLVETSPLIDAGIYVGMPYLDVAPDINYTEYVAPTLSLPVVLTSSVTDIGQTTATGGGNVTESGGATVSARGICWSTSANPTTADSKTIDGSGLGIYSSIISGLTINTPYYVRAYATNSVGTAYGNEVLFTAGPPLGPMVVTNAVTINSNTIATGGGSVVSAGGGTITSRGVCWALYLNPTVSDNTASASAGGEGTYTVVMNGLTPGLTYYVRAWATNATTTSYGNNVPFTMTQYPLVRDYNIYLIRTNTNLWRMK